MFTINIFSSGKNFLTKHPYLIPFFVPIYNKSFGLNKIKIKGKKNKIFSSSFLKNSRITINGNNNIIDLGYLSFFRNCNFYISGNNNRIIINNNVISIQTDYYIEENGNLISIGNKTNFEGKTHLAATEGKSILIGEDCLFSSDIVIRTGDSHSIIEKNSKIRINQAKNVTIGNHVWIGNKVIVLKGSNILDHSIIGSGAVVTKQFKEDNIIIGGNPAIILKNNIDWLHKRI